MITPQELSALRSTVSAIHDVLNLVKNESHRIFSKFIAIATCPNAIASYRITLTIAFHIVMLTAALAFFSGVLARKCCNHFSEWAERFVEDSHQPLTPPTSNESNQNAEQQKSIKQTLSLVLISFSKAAASILRLKALAAHTQHMNLLIRTLYHSIQSKFLAKLTDIYQNLPKKSQKI